MQLYFAPSCVFSNAPLESQATNLRKTKSFYFREKQVYSGEESPTSDETGIFAGG